jgi:hypothetical protein
MKTEIEIGRWEEKVKMVSSEVEIFWVSLVP